MTTQIYSVEHPSQESADRVSISSIGCVTRDRIDALRRGLVSYIDNARLYLRTEDFVVMDDSPTTKMRAFYRDALRSLSKEHGVSIWYAGLEEKILFAKKLIDADLVPPDVIKFALFDVEQFGLVTIGANLNALMLHTIGDAILSVDDDTVCQIASAPCKKSGISYVAQRRFSSSHPWEIYTFATREAVLHSAPYIEADILGLHEDYLGKRICLDHSATAERQQSCDMSHTTDEAKGRVAVTLNGLMGDCGWGSPFYYLLLSDDSLERLIESEANYRSACASREMLRVVNCPTISSESDNMMATFFGLDNRRLLPPFIPVSRGADYVFGVTLSQCLEDALFAHLPWSLLHLPVEPRSFSAGEIFRSASGADVDALVSTLIRSVKLGGPDDRTNMQNLGRRLEEIGSLPPDDFEAVARSQVSLEAMKLAAHLEDTLLAQDYAPEYWTRDVKECIELLHRSFKRRDAYVPLDLLYGRDIAEARELTQRIVRKFGRLLYWWPELTDAARTLKARGHRLARPV